MRRGINTKSGWEQWGKQGEQGEGGRERNQSKEARKAQAVETRKAETAEGYRANNGLQREGTHEKRKPGHHPDHAARLLGQLAAHNARASRETQTNKKEGANTKKGRDKNGLVLPTPARWAGRRA